MNTLRRFVDWLAIRLSAKEPVIYMALVSMPFGRSDGVLYGADKRWLEVMASQEPEMFQEAQRFITNAMDDAWSNRVNNI